MSNRFYLIQRGTFNKNLKEATALFGSSSSYLIDPDYMGSAEFEFGAIPKAYRRIIHQYSDYKLHITDITTVRGVPFCIYCRDEYYEEILTAIKEYINKPYNLKEWTNMEYHFRELNTTNQFDVDRYKYAIRTNFWWCIDINKNGHHIGDWMAFIGATDRQNRFTEIISNDYSNWWMKKTPEEREDDIKKAYRSW